MLQVAFDRAMPVYPYLHLFSAIRYSLGPGGLVLRAISGGPTLILLCAVISISPRYFNPQNSQ